MSLFRDLSAFPLTPADEAGIIDEESLRGLLRRLKGRVGSVGLLGSTGIHMYLDRAQRRRAIETAVDELAGAVPLMAGISALRTDDAIRFGQDARAAGADAVLIAPVSYTPLSDDEVFEHIAAVAGAVGLPVCVYNNPTTTHFTVSPALTARLARVPGVAAVKNPGAGGAARLDELRGLAPAPFSLGVSGDFDAADAMLAGADCWYSVLAGLFPEVCQEIVEAARRGDAIRVRRLDAALAPVWAVFRDHGGLRVMYATANRLGLIHAAPPRPILPLVPAEEARVADALRRLGAADQGR